MKILYLLLISFAFSLLLSPAYGQLYRLKNKVENKVEDAAIDAIFGKKKDKNSESDSDFSEGGDSSTGSGRSRASNKGGAGLVTTPPDVNKYLTEAETSYNSTSYNKARSALQQAMLGVELEIGQLILKSLPESISGLNKDEKADQVTSTGYGWAGLTINRVYSDGDDKEFQVTIANNSTYLTAMNMFMTSGTYAQTGEQQNWKKTTVKGHDGIISYDDYDGYKLSVPLGQSSFLVFQGINFADEADMMVAANVVDIDDIKMKLGEQ
ncbi:hypothetical protein BH23BAC1_BH23BAC1_10080 [soil metagenome]